MASLVARKGDTQALKALIAAVARGSSLQFVAVPDTAAVRSKGANPFGTNTVVYLGVNGLLTESNAVAQLLGGSDKHACMASAAVRMHASAAPHACMPPPTTLCW